MKAVVTFFAFLFFLHFANPALAVTVSITDFPSTISQDSYTITASISGAATGTNYLRIDLYKDSTTNYFGETFNGSDWYGGSTYSQYFPVNIQSGIVWSGTIQGRVGSPSSTQYDWSGVYKLRLRRYTSGGGNTASEADASAVTISISLPTPTLTLTPTPTTAPTNTPTPTPTPTAFPTPTPTPTPTKAPTPIPTTNAPTSKPTVQSGQENVSQNAVLGESTSKNGLAIEPPPDGVVSNDKDPLLSGQAKKPDTIFQGFLIILGIALIAISIMFTLKIIKRGEQIQNEEE